MCQAMELPWVWSNPHPQHGTAASWGGDTKDLHLCSLVHKALVKLEKKVLIPRNGAVL